MKNLGELYESAKELGSKRVNSKDFILGGSYYSLYRTLGGTKKLDFYLGSNIFKCTEFTISLLSHIDSTNTQVKQKGYSALGLKSTVEFFEYYATLNTGRRVHTETRYYRDFNCGFTLNICILIDGVDFSLSYSGRDVYEWRSNLVYDLLRIYIYMWRPLNDAQGKYSTSDILGSALSIYQAEMEGIVNLKPVNTLDSMSLTYLTSYKGFELYKVNGGHKGILFKYCGDGYPRYVEEGRVTVIKSRQMYLTPFTSLKQAKYFIQVRVK